MPEFSPLTKDEERILSASRAHVAHQLAATGKSWPGSTVSDSAALLQSLIDQGSFGKDREAGLQAVGVCFGDLLCELGPLRWMHTVDTLGAWPMLRWKETSVALNAKYAIGKRVRVGEPINMQDLLQTFLAMGERMEKGDTP